MSRTLFILATLTFVACPKTPPPGPAPEPAPMPEPMPEPASPPEPVAPEVPVASPEPGAASTAWTLRPLAIGDGGLSARESVWSLANDADGALLVGARDVGVYRVDGKGGPATMVGDVPEVQIVAARGTIVLIGEYGRLTAWDSAAGKVAWSVEISDNPSQLSFSPDGATVLAVFGPALHRLDARTGATRWTWHPPRPKDPGLVDGIGSAALSADGKVVYTQQAGRVVALDAGSGKELRQLLQAGEFAGVLALSPGGDRLVVGSWDKSVRLVDPASGAVTASFPLGAWASAATWRGDGAMVAWMDLDGVIEVRTPDGALVASATLPEQGGETGLLWRPDGTLAAWADEEAWVFGPP